MIFAEKPYNPRALSGALIAWLLWTVLAGGCSGPGLMLEEYTGETWRKVPCTMQSVTGRREGYLAHTTIQFAAERGDRITIHITVSVNPQPRMEQGTWELEAAGAAAGGNVTPARVEFLGGQGGAAGIGGKFFLNENGHPRFRLRFPPVSPPRQYS
jgi:hypothetical protein